LNEIESYLDYTSVISIDSKITEIVHTISVYIRLDRDWVNLPRISVEYENEVEEFIQFVQCKTQEI